MEVEAANVSLRSFRNRYMVDRIQEVEEAAAKIHSQIKFSFSGMVSNLLDELSESHIFQGQSDNPCAAAAVVVVEEEEEMEQLVLHLILPDSFPHAPSYLHSVIPNRETNLSLDVVVMTQTQSSALSYLSLLVLMEDYVRKSLVRLKMDAFLRQDERLVDRD